MRDLAEQAFQLSVKYGLSDELKLIQNEELKLARLVSEEQDMMSKLAEELSPESL